MKDKVKELPTYTHKQEIYNSLTHLVGFLFAVAITIYFLCLGKPFSFIYPFIIYSFFMMMMFFVSAFYHSQKLSSKSKAIARIIDHSDIHLFVAATYTPICLIAIHNSTIAYIILALEWALAIVGVILNLVDLNHKAIKIVTYALYLLTGWAIIFFYPFQLGISFDVFLWVLLGGIAYTVGAVLYAIGNKNLWYHTVFHVFVLLGAVLQFIGIYFLL